MYESPARRPANAGPVSGAPSRRAVLPRSIGRPTGVRGGEAGGLRALPTDRRCQLATEARGGSALLLLGAAAGSAKLNLA